MARVSYLDGLRGVAAIQVVLSHFSLAFAPRLWGVFVYVANGDVAVHIFFLLSGLVLTNSFERSQPTLLTGAIRRFVRLAIPLMVAGLFAVLLTVAFPDIHFTAAQISKALLPPLFRPHGDFYRSAADLSGFTMLFGDDYTTLFGRLRPYLPTIFLSADTPTWSLHIEFWGSLLVLGLVRVQAKLPALYRPAVILALLICGGNALILFVLGHFAAHFMRSGTYARWTQNPKITLAACGMLPLGVFVYSNPNLLSSYSIEHTLSVYAVLSPYAWMSVHGMVGAILVFSAILLLPKIQMLLSGRVPRFLGRISFAIYLVHWPIFLTFGSAVFVVSADWGYRTSLCITAIACAPVLLVLAILFERFVDQPAMALARSIMLPRKAAPTLPT